MIRHLISFSFLFFYFFTLRVYFVYIPLCRRPTPEDSNSNRFRTNPDDSGRLRATPTTPNDSGRLRTTPNDSGRLRTTPDVSGRLQTTPDDSVFERLRIILGGPTFQSRFRNYRTRIGVDFGLMPTLPITSVVCVFVCEVASITILLI